MTSRIEDLYKALNGELEKERQRKNQEAWKWAKENDPACKQMLLDAKQYTKRGGPMIGNVIVKMK